MHFYRIFIFISLVLLFSTAFSQPHELLYYQKKARENNPVLKENLNLQQINYLQNNITDAQFHKPQIYFTADYLLAPYFFNKGRIFSITPEPDRSAFGYDAGLSNGGLYAAQLNVAMPLLTRQLINTYYQQVEIQNQVLAMENQRMEHDLDKLISDQYIAAYQWQELLKDIQKIIRLVENRKTIVETLVQKGLMQQQDNLLLEIEIKQREFEAHQLQINLVAAFQELNNTCGIFDTTIYDLATPVLKQTSPVQSYFYHQKFELDSTNIAVQEQVLNTKYRPQLDAFGNSGLNSADASNITHHIGYSAGLHLQIPLYDGGQQATVAQQNKLLVENMRHYEAQQDVFLQNNIASVQQQIDLTNRSFDMIHSTLSSQEQLLKIIQEKVVTGQVSVTDYLNAVQDYVTTLRDEIQTQTNLWLLINQYNYVNW